MTVEKPILDVAQAIEMYKHLLKPKPDFGTDIYTNNFKSEGVILIEDNSYKAKGKAIRFDCYALILRLQGDSTRYVNQYSYNIEAYSLQLINPGALFSFEDISSSAKSFVLLFDVDFIEVNYELISFHKSYEENIQLDVKIFSKVLDTYENINSEFKIKDEGYIDFIKVYITQILYILKREKQKIQNNNSQTQAQKLSSNFLSLIEDNFKELKKVSDYAELLDVTSNHLSQTVKEVLKNNALSFINIRIIREIDYLLSDTNISIKNIATKLNFDSHSQMSRFYKHNTSQTPKEFRTNLL